MKKTVNCPPKLQLFIEELQKNFGKFIVLRGYENLPKGFSNDIDIYVQRGDLGRLFKCIKSIEIVQSKISILISRLGLIKCELDLEGEIIPFDIMYGFFYGGLGYQNCNDLFDQADLHHSELFYIPSISDEIRVSILKELLHNKRVRSDKADYLLQKMNHCLDSLPNEFFDLETLLCVQDSIVKGNLHLPRLSNQIRLKLLYCNLSEDLFKTLKNVFLFFAIKYLWKNRYHQKIIA